MQIPRKPKTLERDYAWLRTKRGVRYRTHGIRHLERWTLLLQGAKVGEEGFTLVPWGPPGFQQDRSRFEDLVFSNELGIPLQPLASRLHGKQGVESGMTPNIAMLDDETASPLIEHHHVATLSAPPELYEVTRVELDLTADGQPGPFFTFVFEVTPDESQNFCIHHLTLVGSPDNPAQPVTGTAFLIDLNAPEGTPAFPISI